MIKFFGQTGKSLTGRKFHVNIAPFRDKRGYCAAVLSPTETRKWTLIYSQRVYSDELRESANVFMGKLKGMTDDHGLIDNVAKFFDEII